MSIRNLSEEQIQEMLNMGRQSGVKSKDIKKAQFSQLEPRQVEGTKEDISYLNDVEIELQAELGSAAINLREVMHLHEGQVIPLNRIAGDTIDLKVNDIWLAYGEVLILNDAFAIRISSFMNGKESARSVK